MVALLAQQRIYSHSLFINSEITSMVNQLRQTVAYLETAKLAKYSQDALISLQRALQQKIASCTNEELLRMPCISR